MDDYVLADALRIDWSRLTSPAGAVNDRLAIGTKGGVR